MEFKRDSVISLYLAGKPQVAIAEKWPLKFQEVPELTPQQKENRLKRAKELLRLAESGELPDLFFSDEKTFVVQQFVNNNKRK